jgi:tryptophan synthase alpha chain
LVAPTSTDARIRLAAERTDGWLYVVSVTGTTGARDSLSTQLSALAGRVRRLAPRTPLYAGFGISSPELARQAAALVDGVIVGSRAVEVAGQGAASLHSFVRSLRTAIDKEG